MIGEILVKEIKDGLQLFVLFYLLSLIKSVEK